MICVDNYEAKELLKQCQLPIANIHNLLFKTKATEIPGLIFALKFKHINYDPNPQELFYFPTGICSKQAT